MYIIILSEFSYQTASGSDENAIDISEADLFQIGKSKKFDVENKTVVDYDVNYEQKQEINLRISSLKGKLSSTDYIVLKYIEGQLSETDYINYKNIRQSYRDEINVLELELSKL